MDVESAVKALEDRVSDTESDVKDLQTAMLGSVSSDKKGFLNQLLKCMEKLDEVIERINKHDLKFETYDREKNKFEGWVRGAFFMGGILGSILLNVILKKSGIL